MLECLRAKGGAALNIIPDRNWNYADPKVRAAKVANLRAVVAAADRMGLPINIGTEMNKHGLPFVDDLAAEALRPHRESFLRGARIMVGHTALRRYGGYAYAGRRAAADFNHVWARNAFFEAVGRLPPLTLARAATLEDLGEEKALSWFHDAILKTGGRC